MDMAKEIKKLTATLCSLFLAWVGCNADTAAEPAASEEPEVAVTEVLAKMDLSAKVDPATATVELPGDRFAYFMPGEEERLEDAKAVAEAVCEKRVYYYDEASEIGTRRGIKLRSPAPPEHAMFNELGPWTEEMATRFAYTGPSTVAEQVYRRLIPPPPGFLEEDFRQRMAELHGIFGEECKDKSTVNLFDQGRLEDTRPREGSELAFPSLEDKLAKTAGFQAALADLQQCYDESGIRLEEKQDGDRTYTVIGGADYHRLNQTQIDLALKDVQCKTKVDFVNRVAQEAAKLQGPILAKHYKKLAAWRAEVDETLRKADAYVAAHEEVIRKD